MNNIRFSKEDTENIINKLYTEKGIKIIEYNDSYLYDRIYKISEEVREKFKDSGLDKMDILYKIVEERVKPILRKEYSGVSILCENNTGKILLFQKCNDTDTLVNSNRLN